MTGPTGPTGAAAGRQAVGSATDEPIGTPGGA